MYLDLFCMYFTRIPNESKIHFGIHMRYVKIHMYLVRGIRYTHEDSRGSLAEPNQVAHAAGLGVNFDFWLVNATRRVRRGA